MKFEICGGIDNFIKNRNQGLDKEIATFMSTLSDDALKNFLPTLLKRNDGIKIKEMFDSDLGAQLKEKILALIIEKGYTGFDDIVKVSLVSQDEKVGPSDIIIEFESEKLGISVKFNNKVTFNPSGQYFLSKQSVEHLKSKIAEVATKFIEENQKNDPKNSWFRNRGKSVIRNYYDFLNEIAECACEDWNTSKISMEDKQKVLDLLQHKDSPIEYIILNISIKRKKWNIVIEKRGTSMNSNNIWLKNSKEMCYLYIMDNNQILGRLQVKYNNGIINEHRGKNPDNYDYDLNGLKIKFDNPLGSWNWTPCSELNKKISEI